ncbi:MAG TPA: hypothetical protein VLF94_05085 [Chlamydiales bacterium]|nr:hypothetical protein [Chlamydiales bacterium]
MKATPIFFLLTALPVICSSQEQPKEDELLPKDPLIEVLQPVSEPVKEELTESVKEEQNEPAKEELTESIKEEQGEPVKEELTESVKEEQGEPVKEELTESVESEPADEREEKPIAMNMSEKKEESVPEPAPRWYFELKPGYYYFTESSMREFYDTGGFTMRGEVGCRFWGPLIVWLDGGYFQKDGISIGGDHEMKIMLGTITLGLKAIYYFHDSVAVYAGAGPRLFMMIQHNGTPFIREADNAFGLGGGFNGGLWFFPFFNFKNNARNIFFDLFADYSLSTLKVEEDELSSEDFDVNVSGVTMGLGVGIRF